MGQTEERGQRTIKIRQTPWSSVHFFPELQSSSGIMRGSAIEHKCTCQNVFSSSFCIHRPLVLLLLQYFDNVDSNAVFSSAVSQAGSMAAVKVCSPKSAAGMVTENFLFSGHLASQKQKSRKMRWIMGSLGGINSINVDAQQKSRNQALMKKNLHGTKHLETKLLHKLASEPGYFQLVP